MANTDCFDGFFCYPPTGRCSSCDLSEEHTGAPSCAAEFSHPTEGLSRDNCESACYEPIVYEELPANLEVELPMAITAPGRIRVACPAGLLGTMVLACEAKSMAEDEMKKKRRLEGDKKIPMCEKCLMEGFDYCISTDACTERATATCAGQEDHITGDQDWGQTHSMVCPSCDCPAGQVMEKVGVPCPEGFEAPRTLSDCSLAAACFGFPPMAERQEQCNEDPCTADPEDLGPEWGRCTVLQNENYRVMYGDAAGEYSQLEAENTVCVPVGWTCSPSVPGADFGAGKDVVLTVPEHECQTIPKDICQSFGTACGMCGKDEPTNPRGYCDTIKRRGLCSRPRYYDKCQETCCYED
jgi:hypothetical protein